MRNAESVAELDADIVVCGGGLGGCAAALAAAQMGRSLVLTEETPWLGGQLSSQGVPPDENHWIESFGGTRSYQEFRTRIRAYYRRNYPMTGRAMRDPLLNPGNAWVSRIAHEPRVAVAVLWEMLAPYIHSGKVRLLLEHKPVAAEVDGDEIRSMTLQDLRSGALRTLRGKLFLDATELGDALPLTGTEYVTGAESHADTGEPHAPLGPPRPLNMQAITHCFIVDYVAGRDATIDRPEAYDFWRSFVPDLTPNWPGKLLSWSYTQPRTGTPINGGILGPPQGTTDLWRYRRLIDPHNFEPGFYNGDVVVINWPQNDYFLGPIIECSEEEREAHLAGAKQLSLSLLYWLQTEAPRPDGGVGYPGLRLRTDAFGTEDGLALYPYVRESRRIKARFTILEQHVSREVRGHHGAQPFDDSVGIGHYQIDLHPSTGGDNYIDFPACPFQIPLGSLIPVRMRNLLAAGKNLGVTHVTNGCYRLHPVEWNVGEAAGYAAALCCEKGFTPEALIEPARLNDLQRLLERAGVRLEWPTLGPRD